MPTEFESVAVIEAVGNLIAKVAMPGAGLVEVIVPAEGTTLVAFLALAEVDLEKSQDNGISFINSEGRTLEAESTVEPGDLVTAASARDNG